MAHNPPPRGEDQQGKEIRQSVTSTQTTISLTRELLNDIAMAVYANYELRTPLMNADHDSRVITS